MDPQSELVDDNPLDSSLLMESTEEDPPMESECSSHRPSPFVVGQTHNSGAYPSGWYSLSLPSKDILAVPARFARFARLEVGQISPLSLSSSSFENICPVASSIFEQLYYLYQVRF